VEIDKKTTIDVKCTVKNLSFSAHADAKGIMQLIRLAEPRNVLLVHGEKGKMYLHSYFHIFTCYRQFLKQKIRQKFQIGCFDPPNGTTVTIDTAHSVPVDLSVNLLKRQLLSYDSASTNDDKGTCTSHYPSASRY
jgi:integrator complex subunit 11